MSDYGSDDDLLDDVDVDELLLAGSKRHRSSQGEKEAQSPNPNNKRVKVLDNSSSDHDQYDSIARSILKTKFGYDNFRHEQAAAIRTILKGDNALAIFPTGAGKSLCYQVCSICSYPIQLV